MHPTPTIVVIADTKTNAETYAQELREGSYTEVPPGRFTPVSEISDLRGLVVEGIRIAPTAYKNPMYQQLMETAGLKRTAWVNRKDVEPDYIDELVQQTLDSPRRTTPSMCPNPDCHNSWHGLPTSGGAGYYSNIRSRACPGSHLFDENGERVDSDVQQQDSATPGRGDRPADTRRRWFDTPRRTEESE